MRISIAGTGYVGLTSGVCFAEWGHEVCCYDINKEKIDGLNEGKIPIYEPGLEQLLDENKKRIIFTTDPKKAFKFGDVIFIGVGTPSKKDGSVDMSYVDNVATDIGKNISSYKVIVNKSTVPVGTTERVRNIIKRYYNGEFDVISSPEFLREGSAVHDTLYPDRVVIGAESEKAKNKMREIYEGKIPGERLFITDSKSSELIKYVSNTFLAFSISYMNKLTRKHKDYNVEELSNYFREKINPKGFFSVGLGFGGSCFPKDVREFVSFCDSINVDSGFFKEILEINEFQKLFFMDKIKKLEKGSTIGLLGLSFKPNTDDMRDAPSISIVKELNKLGYRVKGYDPVAMDEAGRVLEGIAYSKNPEELSKNVDALILVTEWDEFKKLNPSVLVSNMNNSLVFDGRNVFNKNKMDGIEYYDIGRGGKSFSDKDKKVDEFLGRCKEFALKLEEVCDKVGANYKDVLKGATLDSRIGDNVFKS
ncbi:MAG: nucleotide sugar dehydrogenase [Candidatus Nanoarchaeia archaeon]|nr:nucleotide sugar dehydrogenase [Candidatus Nanoarchaeia archaeon]